jgi:hypothetical protein
LREPPKRKRKTRRRRTTAVMMTRIAMKTARRTKRQRSLRQHLLHPTQLLRHPTPPQLRRKTLHQNGNKLSPMTKMTIFCLKRMREMTSKLTQLPSLEAMMKVSWRMRSQPQLQLRRLPLPHVNLLAPIPICRRYQLLTQRHLRMLPACKFLRLLLPKPRHIILQHLS